MNNNCFTLGDVTLGVKCGPVAMDYVLHIINVTAPLPPGRPTAGEVCPGEWVYHYVDTSTLGAGHYGDGHHLRFQIDKLPGGGGMTAVTRHLVAPIKLVPPFVSLSPSLTAGNATRKPVGPALVDHAKLTPST